MNEKIKDIAKQLGEAIKEDERIIRLNRATIAYESDMELLTNVSRYNELSKKLADAFETEGRDSDTVKNLGGELRDLYEKIMQIPTMIEFNEAKEAVDKFMEEVNGEVMYTVTGTRPCSHDGCDGDCSHCHG